MIAMAATRATVAEVAAKFRTKAETIEQKARALGYPCPLLGPDRTQDIGPAAVSLLCVDGRTRRDQESGAIALPARPQSRVGDTLG